MQTNPARRFASAVASLLGCLLLIALFMVQLRYTGYESGLVPVAHANGNAVVAHVPASPRTTVTAEYCSEVVAALDPNNPSGRTSTQLTFDDSWFFHDARTYQHDLATACSVLAAVCNSESQYYDGVAGSLPYAERTLGALGFHDVRTESYAMRSSVLDEVSSLLVGSSDVAAYTLASKTIASDGDGKPVTLLFVGIRGTYGAEWLSNFNFLGRVLGHRGVGRCDVRHVHAFPRREPVGAAAIHQGADAEHAACHAVSRPEPRGVQALFA